MDETHAPDGDPVEKFLDSRFLPSEDGKARQAILLRTTRLLRRRRRIRQLSYLAALAACYVAGLGTMRLWMDILAVPTSVARPESSKGVAPQSTPFEDSERATLPLVDSVARPESSKGMVLPLEKDPDVPALVIERVASASDERRARLLYLRAGDRYLEDDGDMEAALRCYTLALGSAQDGDLAISAEDNWFLMALKRARLEEISHAKNGG